MTTSDMIRELCDRMNISLAELCRRIGQTPQNFNKKLQRGTVSSEEMAKIAETLGLDMSRRLCCRMESEFKLNLVGYHFEEIGEVLRKSGGYVNEEEFI